MKSMLYKVIEAILLLTIPLWSVSALSQEAESYYVENVETIIQSKCIGCHRSGGQAGGTTLARIDLYRLMQSGERMDSKIWRGATISSRYSLDIRSCLNSSYN